MKILLAGTNIASQISICVQAFRGIGEQARGLVTEAPGDVIQSRDYIERIPPELDRRGAAWLKRKLSRYRKVLAAVTWADVIHWHFTDTLLSRGEDLEWARFLKRPGVVEFWGSDIRVSEVEEATNPYFAKYIPGDYKRMLTFERSRQAQRRFADAGFGCVVSCPSLLPYIDAQLFPKVHQFRQRLVTSDYEPCYPKPDNRRPVIVHSPSNPQLKGTVYVREAIGTLSRRYDLEFVLIQNVSHSEALRRLHAADIVVDQLLLGSHGVGALEAMAAGKPTVCYIKPAMIPQYPSDLPIVNATVDDITDVLEKLIQSGELRHELGRRGRAYVERHHDGLRIANDMKAMYASLLSARHITGV